MAKVYKSIDDLVEGAKTACRVFIAHCKLAGLDVFITETYRSQSRQNELYAQGRSKPGKIVTNAKWSNHTGRKAWDIAFSSTLYSDYGKFYTAGAIAEKLCIEWGGNWKKEDLPHFQYLGGEYMLPTAFVEARKIADIAHTEGIITDADLWYAYMTGVKPVNCRNVAALLGKVTGCAGGNADRVAYAQQLGILTDGAYWLRILQGAEPLSAGNLRALFANIIAVKAMAGKL